MFFSVESVWITQGGLKVKSVNREKGCAVSKENMSDCLLSVKGLFQWLVSDMCAENKLVYLRRKAGKGCRPNLYLKKYDANSVWWKGMCLF